MLHEKEAIRYHREPRPGKIEVVPLKPCLPDAFIQTVASLEPTFGGINLEDIKAPDCFYDIEPTGTEVDVQRHGEPLELN